MTKKKQAAQAVPSRVVQGQEVCDATEAARALGVSRLTIMNWMDKGIIQYHELPSGVRKPLVASVRMYLGHGSKKGRR